MHSEMRMMKIDFSQEGYGVEYGLQISEDFFGKLTMIDESTPRLLETEDGDAVKVGDREVTFISSDRDRFESLLDFIMWEPHLIVTVPTPLEILKVTE